jgi:uncharacterized OB-fold protein
MSERLAGEAMPDAGTLYSFTTVHVGRARTDGPFAVGYVDLPNGVRVFAHLTGTPSIGDRVTVALRDGVPDGRPGRDTPTAVAR